MAVEPSSHMMDIATKFLEDVPGITWRRFLNEYMDRQYDVVTASYVLNELSSVQERQRITKALWRMTNGVLVFVEPGTPLGFNLIREARSVLLNQTGENEDENPTILAPVSSVLLQII